MLHEQGDQKVAQPNADTILFVSKVAGMIIGSAENYHHLQ
jgi:hypothetical protein